MDTPPATSTAEPFPRPPLPPLIIPTSASDAIPPHHHDSAAHMDAAACRRRIDGIISRIGEMEQRVGDVSRFFAAKGREQHATSKGGPFITKEKASVFHRKDGAPTKRMVELMRQFGTILRNISQHKYAWPFMDPVDVEGLGLHDYYEIIERPMDLGTIKKRMEAKDGTGYKNAREIYSDVILVFTNAMAYNSETHDVHKMAKVMMDKFEEKWQQLLPKVIEEETRQKEEEASAHVDTRFPQEITFVKMTRDADEQLSELSSGLEELKQIVIKKCRKISTEEKRKIAAAFGILPLEEIFKALDVVAQLNPDFSSKSQNIELDIDALDEPTLWSLKFRMDAMLEQQARNSVSKGHDDNTKRKREICDALAKSAKKRSKKLAAS